MGWCGGVVGWCGGVVGCNGAVGRGGSSMVNPCSKTTMSFFFVFLCDLAFVMLADVRFRSCYCKLALS